MYHLIASRCFNWKHHPALHTMQCHFSGQGVMNIVYGQTCSNSEQDVTIRTNCFYATLNYMLRWPLFGCNSHIVIKCSYMNTCHWLIRSNTSSRHLSIEVIDTTNWTHDVELYVHVIEHDTALLMVGHVVMQVSKSVANESAVSLINNIAHTYMPILICFNGL